MSTVAILVGLNDLALGWPYGALKPERSHPVTSLPSRTDSRFGTASRATGNLDPVVKPGSAARQLVHLGRRVRGGVAATRARSEGETGAAVLAAIQQATLGRPSREEAVWIDRIERTRHSLAASVQPLEIADFGAGRRDSSNAQEARAVTRTTRTLGHMTASSKPPRWAYLLFRLARELQPVSALEMGACVGISAAYQAAAMELNDSGVILSLEGSDVLAERSTRTLDDLGLSHRANVRLGAFSDTLDTALGDTEPLDWAFIDGHHNEAATMKYTSIIVPRLAPNAIVIYDDINWSPGMASAWHQIVSDSRYELTIDLKSMGLAIRAEDSTLKRALSIPYG